MEHSRSTASAAPRPWLSFGRAFTDRTVLGVPVRSITEALLGAVLAYRFFVKLRSTRGHVVWDWHIVSVLHLEAVFVIALLLLVGLAFPRRRLVAWSVTFVVASVLMLTAATYASYAGGILTVRDVVLAGQVPDVWSSVTSLLSAYWVRYVADIPVVLALACWRRGCWDRLLEFAAARSRGAPRPRQSLHVSSCSRVPSHCPQASTT